jgi:adenine/guanine phosphoribosyltransferase-like PRPP-binding protein
MTRDLTSIITDGFTRFSDSEFEERYFKITTEVRQSETVIVDFRWKEWFDLWALIQLLFIFSENEVKKKRRIIRLLSPKAVVQTEDNDSAEEYAIARLRFLSDMEFLDRAVELGVELWLQYTPDRKSLRPASPNEIRQIVAEIIDPEKAAESSRPIIPITRLRVLDLKERRDRLYQRTDEIFGEFLTESIVQQAGLGDCLLSELVMNVKHHGGGEGYVALRAGKGLRGVKRKSLQDYERRKNARLNHPLSDWRTYFQRYPDDGYFELLVADRGQGIAASISEDPRIPLVLSAGPDSLEKYHALLQHALLPDTSRLSPQERQRMDLTAFTGLAAVGFVLTAHEGALLIRERKSRHVFGAATTSEGAASEQITTRKKESRKLNTIQGVSVTAIVPMQGGHHHELPGFPTSLEKNNSVRIDPSALQGIAVYRVNSPTATYLNQRFGMSWGDIATGIKALSATIDVILVDVLASSIDKNELWSGLTKVRRACKARGMALVLAGLEQRLAHRLEEYASLDRKRISSLREWILFGFGDDRRMYCFGEFGTDQKQKHSLAQRLIDCFQEGQLLAGGSESLLNEASYLKHKVSPLDAEEEAEEIDSLNLRASLSQLWDKLHDFYSRSLEEEIKQSRAWLPDKTVLLTGGDKVADYLCIHSMTQLRDLYPDISRLLISTVSTLDFDFILSVGVASQAVAKDIWKASLQRKLHTGDTEGQINFYAYHDYFGFDHGEMAKPIIGQGAKVLLLVDGVRKGDHCREVIEHIKDCEASVIAICALFNLSDQDPTREIHEIPLHCVLRIPVRQADHAAAPDFFENPYTYNLSPAEAPGEEEWQVFLTKRQAYRYIEGYGLILCGHKAFFDQHFLRTISLPYLFNSSTALNAELIHNILTLIENEQIDCILYPEQSSIAILVSNILSKPGVSDRVNAVMCRRAVWPDRSSGYGLDRVGKETLRTSHNVLILEDEVYTGSSIKNLADLCLAYCSGLFKKMLILAVIDSMMKAERTSLSRLLKHNPVGHSSETGTGGLDVRFFAFMQFSLCRYWKQRSCPLCQQRRQFELLEARMIGFIERSYASRRVSELTPQPIDQNYRARNSLHLLEEATDYKRLTLPEPIFISTLEGLEVLCEETYVEGDLHWLVDRIRPNHLQHFAPDVLLAAIELLSRDMALLLRVRLRYQMLEHVRYLLIGSHLQGEYLARLLEILCDWPLHCLNHVWEDLWEAVFSNAGGVDAFMESYPGAEILLSAVESRPERPLRKKLLTLFDEYLSRLFAEILPNDVASRKRAQMAMCLRRSAYRERPAHKNLGVLIADITFVASYFEIDDTSESHFILRRGLLNLEKCKAGDEAKTYVHAVQLASHLLHLTELLPLYDPAAKTRINGHGDYSRLKEAIEAIQKAYPRHGQIVESHKIQTYASEIEEILYSNHTQNSFQTSLIDYLEDYRRPLEEVLSTIQLWATRHNAKLDFLPKELALEGLYIVLNSAAVHSVFEELTINFERTRSRWEQRQAPLTSLLDDLPPFTVEVAIDQNMDTIVVAFTNPCTEKEYIEMKNSKKVGMGQMKTFLDSLGHSYELHFIPDKVTQTFSLRRIHK